MSAMAFFDLPVDELRRYSCAEPEPADFDSFWESTLASTRAQAIHAQYAKLTKPNFNLIDVYDVSFAGFEGQRVKGWMIVPADDGKKRPCVVSYIGYGGGRGLPIEHLAPAVCGFAHFVCDTRGQGSSWAHGDTPDEGTTGPQYPGFMTRGIESKETYYYRRVFTDAVRAVDAACEFPNVDQNRIAVSGSSQGGGIAIAVAGLLRNRVKLLLADVPFLCHFRRACTIVDTEPYIEIVRYLKIQREKEEKVFQTLRYFDGVNFARRVSARSLFSVALMDTTCPPSTVFAAYNNLKPEKSINVYPYNGHEGGGALHQEAKMNFCQQHL